MLRILLTGLALSMPLAALGQDSPDATATAAPETPQPAADGDNATAQPAAPQAARAEPAKPAPPPAEATASKPPQYLPNLFDVTVIETWDTLNIREKPDGRAKVIATLPATAKGVELVGRDPTGKWGKVNSGESTGWVALRFLKQQAGVWQQAAVPQSLSCLGTEPFWSLKASKSGMTFAESGQSERPLSLRKVLDRGIEGEPTRGLIAGDDKGRFTAFIRPAQCSDGMSDRGYALAVSVIIDGQDIPSRMLTGCCSIAR